MGISNYNCAICGGARCARIQRTNPAYPQDDAPLHTRCKPSCKGGQSCFERTTVVQPISLLAVAEDECEEVDVPEYVLTVYDGYHHYVDPESCSTDGRQLTSGMLLVASSPFFFVDADNFCDKPNQFLRQRGAQYLLGCKVFCRSCWLTSRTVDSDTPASDDDNDDSDASPSDDADGSDDDVYDDGVAGDTSDPLAILAGLAGTKRCRSGQADSPTSASAPKQQRLRLTRQSDASEEEDEGEEEDDDAESKVGPDVPAAIRNRALNARLRKYLRDKEDKRPTHEILQVFHTLMHGGEGLAFDLETWSVALWMRDSFDPSDAEQCALLSAIIAAITGKATTAEAAVTGVDSSSLGTPRATVELMPPYVPPANGQREAKRLPYSVNLDDAKAVWSVRQLLSEMLLYMVQRGFLEVAEQLLKAGADHTLGTFNEVPPVLLACKVPDSRKRDERDATQSKRLGFLRLLHRMGLLHPSNPAPDYAQRWLCPALLAAKEGNADALRLFIEETKTLVPDASFPVGIKGPTYDDFTGALKPVATSGSATRQLMWTAAVELQSEALRYLIHAVEATHASEYTVSADVCVPVTAEEADVLEDEAPSEAAIKCGEASADEDQSIQWTMVPILGAVLRAASTQGLVNHSSAALEVVKLLVEKGAAVQGNVRPADVPPRGALWALLGSYHARPEILRYLLDECRCHPDGKLMISANDGSTVLPSSADTPLSRAISHGHWKAVSLLLAAGADKALLNAEEASKLEAYERRQASGEPEERQCVIM